MRRLVGLDSNSSGRGVSHKGGRRAGRVRGVVMGGLASAIAVVGLVAFSTPAFAQDNAITASASCSSPLGNGVQITWTIANDSNVPETGSVTSATGGLGSLNSAAYSIAASPGQPSQTATLTQTLPAGTTGVITLDVSSTWSGGVSEADSGTFDLSTINCAAPQQTIEGHIFLCNNGNPTSTEESGGTLAATGTGLTTVPATLNPSAPSNVIAGTYFMTASSPPGYQLVACGGSSLPNGAGTSATESVDVPSGGAGVGVFYVSPFAASPSAPDPATASPSAPSPATVSPSTAGSAAVSPSTASPATSSPAWSSGSGYPSISLKKSASISSYSSPGTLVTYFYKVTNTGNVTLDPVTVSDPMAGLSAIACPATSLAPWTSETCSATYTTTQGDVDRGSLKNTATATGTPPSGPPVTATSSLCIPACQTRPSRAQVGRRADGQCGGPDRHLHLHDHQHRQRHALRRGCHRRPGLPSLDSSLGPITCTTGTNGSITLAPGATDTCSATYTVTQADLTNNSVTDTGTVTGQPPSGPPVTATSTLSLTVTSVSVVKAASPSAGVVAGSTTPIVYTLTVTNTGSTTTTAPIMVTDSAPTGTTLVAGSPACATGGPPTCTVAVNSGTITWTIPAGVTPGASYTLTYSVTANASDSTGTVTNTASWSGPGCGTAVATVPPTTCPTNTVKTPVTAQPITTEMVTMPMPPTTPTPTPGRRRRRRARRPLPCLLRSPAHS